MRAFLKKHKFLFHTIIIIFEFVICIQMAYASSNLISRHDFDVLLDQNIFFRAGVLAGTASILLWLTFFELFLLISSIIHKFRNRHH